VCNSNPPPSPPLCLVPPKRYETHPAGQTSRLHGDAFVSGDLKIVKTGPTNPSNENGWHVPPGEDKGATQYSIGARCGAAAGGSGASLKDGNAPDQKECSKTWCLFNITADACE
jgi:hypothetical protein